MNRFFRLACSCFAFVLLALTLLTGCGGSGGGGGDDDIRDAELVGAWLEDAIRFDGETFGCPVEIETDAGTTACEGGVLELFDDNTFVYESDTRFIEGTWFVSDNRLTLTFDDFSQTETIDLRDDGDEFRFTDEDDVTWIYRRL